MNIPPATTAGGVCHGRRIWIREGEEKGKRKEI